MDTPSTVGAQAVGALLVLRRTSPVPARAAWGLVLLHERLRRSQQLGVVLALVGVALISLG